MPRLAPCRDCGQMVSRSARRCPHCGSTEPTWAQRVRVTAVVAVVAVGLILTLAWADGHPPEAVLGDIARLARRLWEALGRALL